MCRSRSSLIEGAKKGHGEISRPNPIGKHIQVLQQNPPESCRRYRRPVRQLRANTRLTHCNNFGELYPAICATAARQRCY